MGDWTTVDRYWGVRALDFVDAVEGARTADEVTTLFANTIAEVGYNVHVMIGLPDSQTPFKKRVLVNGWSKEWSDLYTKENLCEVDPVAKHCTRTVQPFDWSEAPIDSERQPQAQSVMQRATDFRMAQGLCVPIHYGDGSGAAVSIAGERVDRGPGVRNAMLLMALYAHHRVLGLLKPPVVRSSPLLTEREQEVVRWVAAGKSNWDIGTILNISERTVRFHIEAASRKLSAVNRASLVSQALRLGEIRL
jgi:LuxR family transcriptional regulator, quorum-sensing system regulator BjaR1